jgi:hypothetical protein
VIDLVTARRTAILGAHEDVGPVDHIAVASSGTRIASCGCDRTVRARHVTARSRAAADAIFGV